MGSRDPLAFIMSHAGPKNGGWRGGVSPKWARRHLKKNANGVDRSEDFKSITVIGIEETIYHRT